jgi:hypothetical protein
LRKTRSETAGDTLIFLPMIVVFICHYSFVTALLLRMLKTSLNCADLVFRSYFQNRAVTAFMRL